MFGLDQDLFPVFSQCFNVFLWWNHWFWFVSPVFHFWLVVSTYPSKKWWSKSQLGWWNSQPFMESHKKMFQTTNQTLFLCFIHSFYLYLFVHQVFKSRASRFQFQSGIQVFNGTWIDWNDGTGVSISEIPSWLVKMSWKIPSWKHRMIWGYPHDSGKLQLWMSPTGGDN